MVARNSCAVTPPAAASISTAPSRMRYVRSLIFPPPYALPSARALDYPAESDGYTPCGPPLTIGKAIYLKSPSAPRRQFGYGLRQQADFGPIGGPGRVGAHLRGQPLERLLPGRARQLLRARQTVPRR